MYKRYTFETAIADLNEILEKENPSQLSSSWIYKNTPSIYRYFWKYIKTETNEINWDHITRNLDRAYSKRWIRYRYKQSKPYSNELEVNTILERYKDKLYTFLSFAEDGDKKIQDEMIIKLVRLGQKGNILAQQELITWVGYITNDWIDTYPQIYKWQGYRDEVEDKIRSCIRCYRYTGSFLGYLFRTLEYSARGKPPLVSLNDKIYDGEKERGEFTSTKEIRLQ